MLCCAEVVRARQSKSAMTSAIPEKQSVRHPRRIVLHTYLYEHLIVKQNIHPPGMHTVQIHYKLLLGDGGNHLISNPKTSKFTWR